MLSIFTGIGTQKNVSHTIFHRFNEIEPSQVDFYKQNVRCSPTFFVYKTKVFRHNLFSGPPYAICHYNGGKMAATPMVLWHITTFEKSFSIKAHLPTAILSGLKYNSFIYLFIYSIFSVHLQNLLIQTIEIPDWRCFRLFEKNWFWLRKKEFISYIGCLLVRTTV